MPSVICLCHIQFQYSISVQVTLMLRWQWWCKYWIQMFRLFVRVVSLTLDLSDVPRQSVIYEPMWLKPKQREITQSSSRQFIYQHVSQTWIKWLSKGEQICVIYIQVDLVIGMMSKYNFYGMLLLERKMPLLNI